MTDTFNHIIRKRAIEKEERQRELRSEHPLLAPSFAEWAKIDRKISDVFALSKHDRNELYQDYQEHMIHMGFLEWDCAAAWGVPKCLNIFNR